MWRVFLHIGCVTSISEDGRLMGDYLYWNVETARAALEAMLKSHIQIMSPEMA